MTLIALDGGAHPGRETLPDPTTIRRERDGEPGSVMNVADYPLTASCLCGEPIRIARKHAAEWQHTT